MLNRMVNGQLVALSASEETALRAEWTTNTAASAKRRVRLRFAQEAARRVHAAAPNIGTVEKARFLRDISPGLNSGSISPGAILAQDIATYLDDEALPAVNSISVVGSLRAVKPTRNAPFGPSGPDWP